MTSVTDDTGEAILDRALETFAGTSSPTSAASGRAAFGKALLTSTDATSLANFSPKSLANEADAAFGWIAEKAAGSPKLAVRSSKLVAPASTRPLSVLEIVNDDMPFLLDSVLGEIQARGCRVHLALHPIYRTQRSADGRARAVTEVGGCKGRDDRQESYIAIHLDRLSEANGHDLVEAVSAILDQVRSVVATRPFIVLILDLL